MMILTGDCLDSLRTLPDESVHCCVTSPPYFGLRDYGVDGQIGLEPTQEEYVERLVAVFREVWRVLRSDGTLWLNLGDSYSGNGRGSSRRYSGFNERYFGKQYATNKQGKHGYHDGRANRDKRLRDQATLPSKNLIGIPWRVAFALQEDGWILRQDIIWEKPNCMPESAKDRCTRSHEYLFMFAKKQRYYYNHEAIMIPVAQSTISRVALAQNRVAAEAEIKAPVANAYKRDESARVSSDKYNNDIDHLVCTPNGNMRNRRTVWTIPTQPYSGAHFAVFPLALIEPCILAGCPAGGTVLDPFGGSGTTAVAAIKHRRQFILCELNPEYVKLAEGRIADAESRHQQIDWTEDVT